MELLLGILGIFTIGLPLIVTSIVLFTAAEAPAERSGRATATAE